MTSNSERTILRSSKGYKVEHESTELTTKLNNLRTELPEWAISLSVLKTVECELTRRGSLPAATNVSTPLWFLAETERNVFLWRTGHGLSEQGNFDFWVDIKRLIAKRKNQLGNSQEQNPFVPQTSGNTTGTTNTSEITYLDDFLDVFTVFLPHARAISQASREVRDELEPSSSNRQIIVLPSSGVARRPT